MIKQNLPTEEEIENEALSGDNFLKRQFKVARVERPLFWVLCSLFFIISYVYSVIRDMKDALVIDRLDAGSIPHMKMFIVLPGNMLAIFIIQKMMTNNSISKVFSRVTAFFTAFFVIYGLLLINIQNYIEPDIFRGIDPFADGKRSLVGLEWTRAIYLVGVSYITTIIYLFAELWGSCVLSFLFLSFTNSICTKKQNFRYTPMLLISSNIALVLSGITMKMVAKIKSSSSWEMSQRINVMVFICLGLLSIFVFAIHWYYEKSILLRQIFIPSDNSKKEGKLKIGMLAGLKEVFTSKLVLAMSFMVLAYSITVNMVESPFKSVLPKIADAKSISREEFVMTHNGDNQIYIGLCVILILLFKFSDMIHTFGWISVAIMPPLFSLVSSLIYFPVVHMNVQYPKEDYEGILKTMFPNKDARFNLELYLGKGIVAIYKVAKYAAIDMCKEFISMTIDPVYRAHYKSIFDGVCGKLGKAMGSGITNIENIVMDTTDVRASALYSLLIVVILDACWISAVWYLSKKYEQSIKSNKYIEDEKIFKQDS